MLSLCSAMAQQNENLPMEHGVEGEGVNPVNALDPRVQANIIEQISGQLQTQIAAQIVAAMGAQPGAGIQPAAPVF